MTLSDWFHQSLQNPSAPQVTPQGAASSPHFRFIQASKDGSASPADLAVLLRGVLRHESLLCGYDSDFELPRALADTIRPYAARAGLAFAPHASNRALATPWRPPWLTGAHTLDVDACHLPALRRPLEECAGDPILCRQGHCNYTSKAQRDALRAVLCSLPGDTLAVCLPTGSGKALCAFLPSLLALDEENTAPGVSVIVVPTVALALHLEQRLRPYLPHDTAYRPDQRDAAAAIRHRCASGTQGPVIVSPEALLGKALRESLREAARADYLRYFTIDEAHMVLSWGDEFRPAFLSLAAVRRDLSASSPRRGLVTLLFSATFTDYHLRWLRELFSEEGHFRILHAARLRPEPAFWLARAEDDAVRRTWVEEAVFRLPRPAILYATLRASCSGWFTHLRSIGFSRLAHMDGDTPPDTRQRLLNDWAADRIDLVVATSAFGLGVDKAGVRTILHAELPESVDRFYQDVGRSGRDGRSSVSILITAPVDWRKVARLTRPKFISPQLGLERWLRMFEARKPIGNSTGNYLVNLNVGRELDMAGDYNRSWNLRALQLLRRAGALDFVPNEEASYDEVAIRLSPRPHLDPAFWHGEIEALRREIATDYERVNHLLKRLVRAESAICFSSIFSDCYSSQTFELSVVTACGGCPGCRANGTAPWCGNIHAYHRPPEPLPGRKPRSELMSLLAGSSAALIHFRTAPAAPQAEDLLWWLASQGLVNFTLPPEQSAILREIASRGLHLVLFANERPPRGQDLTARQPTAVWLSDPLPDWWPTFHQTLPARQTPTILVAPAALRCPDHPGRLLRDVFPGQTLDYSAWANQYLA